MTTEPRMNGNTVMAALALGRRYTFRGFCTLRGIGWARDRFWWHVCNHGYTPTTTEPLWTWEAWQSEFDADDLRDTHADALV